MTLRSLTVPSAAPTMPDVISPDTTAHVYDLDIGKDPDDTCVAAMIARDPARFRPTLAITNDETEGLGRARFLVDMLGEPLRRAVASGLPSARRVHDCLVERSGLVDASLGDVPKGGVDRLIAILESHPSTVYFGLGALTNLATALANRPDLAPRVELRQMGPALVGAYHRTTPQYNARLDPASFSAVLRAVTRPHLLLAHTTWARFPPGGDARLELGIYPDDPMGRALVTADHPSVRRFGLHLAAWAASGVACSIMHDPLTVLGYLEPHLVTWEEAEIWLGEDGFADRAPLAGKGAMIRVLLSQKADYAAARAAIAAALLGGSPSESASIARAWAEHNADRPEPRQSDLVETER